MVFFKPIFGSLWSGANNMKYVCKWRSNLDTMIHLLKGNIGTGILAMPDAFRNSGWLVGIFGTMFMAVICTHCMHILVSRSSLFLIKRLEIFILFLRTIINFVILVGILFARIMPKDSRTYVGICQCGRSSIRYRTASVSKIFQIGPVYFVLF